MKKANMILTLILAIFVLFSGCSSNQADDMISTPEIFEDEFFTYEYADFDAYNSPAEENGLGDKEVYIQGELTDIKYLETMIYLVVSVGENQNWMCGQENKGEVTDEIQNLLNQDITVYGIYLGYSEKTEMPGLYVDCIKADGEKHYTLTTFTDTEETTSTIVKELTEGDITYNALHSILGRTAKINSVSEYTTEPAGTKFINAKVSVEDANATDFVNSCYLLFSLFLDDSFPDYDSIWIDIDGKAAITLQSVSGRWSSVFTPYKDEEPICQILESAYNIKFKETDLLLRNK